MLSWFQTLSTLEIISIVASFLTIITFLVEKIFKPIRKLHYKRMMRSDQRIIIAEEYNYLEALQRKLEQLILPIGYKDEQYTRLTGKFSDNELIVARYLISPQSKTAEPEINAGDLISKKQGRFIRNIARTLLRSKVPLVLLGDPGSGKSVTLRHVGLEIIRKELKENQTSPKLPIYIHLSQYTQTENGKPQDLLKFISKYLEEFLECSKPLIQHMQDLIRQHRFVFLFDAMDEMPHADYAKRIAMLKEFSINYSNNKCLFACRKLDYDPRFQHREVAIEPFGTRQKRSFIKKNVRIYSSRLPLEYRKIGYSNLITVINPNHPLSELTSNPFFLKLITVYFFRQGGHLPRRRAELFESYLCDFIERERKRADSTKLPTDEDILDILSRIAYIITCMAEGTTCEKNKLLNEFKRVTNTNCINRINDLMPYLNSILKMAIKGGLLIEVEKTKYRFEHHRFQEYFTARYIDKFLGDFSIEKYIDNLWWQEIIIMLVGITNQPDIIINQIIKSINISLSKNEKEDKVINENHSESIKIEWEMKKKSLSVTNRIEFATKCFHESKKNISEKIHDQLTELVKSIKSSTIPLERVKAIRAASYLGQSNASDIIASCINDANPWVRNEAFSSTLEIGLAINENANTYMLAQFKNRQMLITIIEYINFFRQNKHGRMLIPKYLLLLLLRFFWFMFPILALSAIVLMSDKNALAFKRLIFYGDLSALQFPSEITIWFLSFIASIIIPILLNKGYMDDIIVLLSQIKKIKKKLAN